LSRRPHIVELKGGEDLVSPAMAKKAGSLLFSKNYEATDTGYRRIDGFERFDGRPSPSEASYWVLNFTAGTSAFVVGEVVTGDTSADTGEVLVVTVTSGSWATNDASGYLVLFGCSDVFQDVELITSASGSATTSGTAVEKGATDDTNHNAWLQAAIEATRADIGKPPGSGQIRGVWMYGGDEYNFRDNAGATACVMYKASTAGWVAVDIGHYVDFTAGTTEISVNETVTGGISTATGDVMNVVVTSGTWAGNDAAGRIYLKSVVGTFQAETITSAAGSATCSGVQAANTFLPGGQFEFKNYNFYGDSGSRKMYGVDGVNKGFQWDGTGFCFIHTGMTTDTPRHLFVHKKHLFFSFGSSTQHSSIADPLTWSPITGAGEIATGDDTTGYASVPGDAMAIFDRNSTYLLYGTSSADWNLVTHSAESGAIERSIQEIGKPLYLDDRGLTGLSAVQAYGDFKASTFSKLIQPIIKAKKGLVTASMRVKDKDQYRLFFSDGTGIIGHVTSKGIEFTRVDYGVVVRCCCSAEDNDGNEVLLFGSDDGYVYQMDAGTSFDGGAVEAFAIIAFNNFRSPQYNKQFFKAVFEMDAPLGADIQFSADFSYGSPDAPQGVAETINVLSGGAYFDTDAVFGDFLFDAQVVGQGEAYIEGSGTSMSMTIYSNSTYQLPHTLQVAVIHYSVRGLSR